MSIRYATIYVYIVPQTYYIDDFGVVHIKRSNSWVIYHIIQLLLLCIRLNHDISWIPTREKALAFIYYIVNYATSADVSQILVKAALIADARKNPPSNTTSNSEDNHQAPQDSKFLLRLYNALANVQEVSGVQVASTLLDFPSSYKNLTKFTYISI
jgi:hypothetical protein